MVWRQEKILRTNLQPNPSFRASAGYTTVRTNLVPGGFSVDSDGDGVADGWGAYTAGTVTNITRAVVNGTQRLKATLEATVVSRCGVNYIIPTGYVTSGQPVQISVNLWGTFTTGQVVQVYIDWRDASGGITGTHQFNTDVSQISGSAKVFRTTTGTLPANTVVGSVYVWVAGGTGGGTADLYIDNLIVETASYQGDFFDGSTTNGSFDLNLESAWTGTANASPSVARGQTPADWITLTAQGWRSWIAEDGKSAYLRYVGATTAPLNTAPFYAAGVGQTVPMKSTVSASLKVLGTNPLGISIQGPGANTSPYSSQTSDGNITSITHTFTNPDVTSVRLLVRVPATAPGTTYQITQALLEVSPTVGTYFDGSYPSATAGASYRWNGVANRSSSDMYIPALASPPAGLWDSSTSGYAESWYVDGVDVQSMAFGIETVDSQPPTLKGDHLALSGANGVIPQFNRAYEPGSVVLKMWVLGCEVDGTVPGLRSGRRQLFERNLRMLLRLFGYQGNIITLKKTIYGDSLDSAPITVTARAIVSEVSSIDTQMARQRATVSVALTLVDSFWSDATVTTDTTGASATVPKTLNLTDVGTAPVDDAVIKITGPITSPRVTCPASGSWIQYNGTVSAGQTLTIDSKAGTAFLGTNSVLSNVTHGGTAKFMVIPPRNQGTVTDTGFQTALTLSGSSAGTTTSMSVSYYRKHWVIV